jgi:hypothetical protein
MVFYKPDYSEDSDWKEYWWTVDMQDATYNLLLNQATATYWFMYYFDTDYQLSYSREINIDDDFGDPVLGKALKVTHNVNDSSINILQQGL